MRAQYAEKQTLERLAHMMGAEAWLPMRLMLETGIRVGDAVKARRRDFTRDGDRVVFQWRAEKTGKVGRAEVSDALYRAIAMRAPKAGGGAAFVFPGRKPGTHISRQAIWARLKTACQACGISADGISPHTLRKVCGVNIRRELGFKAAKDALQHTHDSTAAIYAYADRATSPDSPIVWGELDLLAEYIAAKVKFLLDRPAAGAV